MNNNTEMKAVITQLRVPVPTKNYRFQKEICQAINELGFSMEEAEDLDFTVELGVFKKNKDEYTLEEIPDVEDEDSHQINLGSVILNFYGEREECLPEIGSSKIPFNNYSMMEATVVDEVSNGDESVDTICFCIFVYLTDEYKVTRTLPGERKVVERKMVEKDHKKDSLRKVIKKAEKVMNCRDHIFTAGRHDVSKNVYQPLTEIEVIEYAMETIQTSIRSVISQIKKMQKPNNELQFEPYQFYGFPQSSFLGRKDLAKSLFNTFATVELYMQCIRRTIGNDLYKEKVSKNLNGRIKHFRRFNTNKEDSKAIKDKLSPKCDYKDLKIREIKNDVIFYIRSFKEIENIMHSLQVALYPDLTYVCAPYYSYSKDSKVGHIHIFNDYHLIKGILDANDWMGKNKRNLRICYIDIVPGRDVTTMVIPHLKIFNTLGFSVPSRKDLFDLQKPVEEFDGFIKRGAISMACGDDPAYLMEAAYSCVMAAFTAQRIFARGGCNVHEYMSGAMMVCRPFTTKEAEIRTLVYNKALKFVKGVICGKPCKFIREFMIENLPDDMFCLAISVERDGAGKVSGYMLTREMNPLAESLGSVLVNKKDFPKFSENLEGIRIKRTDFIVER